MVPSNIVIHLKDVSNMAADSDCGPKLGEIFSELWQKYAYLENCDDPTASSKVQVTYTCDTMTCLCL